MNPGHIFFKISYECNFHMLYFTEQCFTIMLIPFCNYKLVCNEFHETIHFCLKSENSDILRI